MAYANPRGLPIADMGSTITTLMACTLADYSSGGTQTPLVDDIVTLSSTGNFYAKRAGDDSFVKLGRVTKVELAPTGSAVGYIAVEWLDLIRLVKLDCSVLANASLLNVCSKVGADTTAHDWDAVDATGGNIVCIAKSAATGVGSILGAVFAKDT